MPDSDLKEGTKEVIRLLEKVNTLLKLADNEPVSTGSREDIEKDCIGKLPAEEVVKCRVKKNKRFFVTGYEYGRFLGYFFTSSVNIKVNLYWKYDGCHIYDIFVTTSSDDKSGLWTIKPELSVSKLETKKRGNCQCCKRGGDCVLIKLKLTTSFQARLAIDPEMEETLFTGTLCASDGVLTKK